MVKSPIDHLLHQVSKFIHGRYHSVYQCTYCNRLGEFTLVGLVSSPHQTIEKIKKLSTDAETSLQKIEYSLHLWVAFAIMPLFALTNAGMHIGNDFFSGLINPVSIGIIAGLLAGKFLGVFSFTWILVKLGFAELPEGAGWTHIAGVAILAGVGFTMSLSITGRAFDHLEMIDQAKYGILIASVLAGSVGIIVLRKINWQFDGYR